MRVGVVGVVVHADYERDVRALRGRRDDHLLGSAFEVLGRALAVGEEAGGLDHHVGAELAPGQVGGVALGEHLDTVAVDDDRVALGFDLPLVAAVGGVVVQEVGQRLRVGDVVDRDPLDVRALGLGGAEDVAADPAETVDPDAYGHGFSPSLRFRSGGG